MEDSFDNYLDNPDEDISASASMLVAIQAGYEEGDLTKEQFLELSEDVLQIAEMDELAEDLERKIKIQNAVNAFKLIIGTISK